MSDETEGRAVDPGVASGVAAGVAMRIALDHVGYCGPDLEGMISDFQRLGFQLSEPAELDAGRTESETATQRSAHILFAQNYIELTSVEPCPPAHHLAPYQGDQPSLRLLLFAAADASDTHERLSRRGIEAGPLHPASRRLTYGKRGQVRFEWFGLPSDTLPGTLAGFVQHLDRAQVFDSRQMQHPNGALGITALTYRRDDPSWRWPEWLLDPAAEVELRVGSAELDQAAAAFSAQRFAHEPEEQTERASPLLRGMEVRVRSLDRLRQCLDENAVTHHQADQAVWVPANCAGGASMSFREAA